MTLADEINRMIETILMSSTWTSSGGKNPVENFIKEFRGVETPDLEKIIQSTLETKDAKQPPTFQPNKSKPITGLSKNISKEDAQGV